MRTFVLVGGGQAAAVAARTLRRRGFDGHIEIVGNEPDAPYQRPPLSKEYLGTGEDDGLYLLTDEWCAKFDVRLRLGCSVMRIRPEHGAVELADGSLVAADAVLLATGSSPRRLKVENSDRVCYLRTLRDADQLRDQLRTGARLIVIGAGFIGSEVAATARSKGVEVVMIEALDVPLRHVLGPVLGQVCADIHRRHDVDLRLCESVEAVVETPHGIAVTTRSGRIEGDVLVVGIGVLPNVDVAQRSDITVENGIVVDEFCRTSMTNVYAAGDVANHHHPLFQERVRVEHFDNASRQGAAAADNMLEREVPYQDPHWFWSDQYDVNLQYVGLSRGYDELVVRGSLDDLDCTAFYLREGVVRAAFGVNRGSDVMIAKELISGRVAVSPQTLRDDDVDLADLVPMGA